MKKENICKCIFISFYKGIKLKLDYYKILYKLFMNKDIKTLENIIKNINRNTKYCYNLFTPNNFYGINKSNTIISSDDNDNIIVNEKNNVKV